MFSIYGKMQGFKDECVIFFLSFYAEIQDGCKKWHDNDFLEKSPVLCRHPGAQKNCSKSHNISEINVFLHFTQKFKMATKNGRKTVLRKSHK